ncbi:RNase H domain-containing protein [Trichonephila clavipes]|nr:RNase H domain-containing protein [Trichonephila clavipes]
MLDHLEDNIRRVIADIRPQMLEKVIDNWTSRLDYIRASRGSHMPEILFKINLRTRLSDGCFSVREKNRSSGQRNKVALESYTRAIAKDGAAQPIMNSAPLTYSELHSTYISNKQATVPPAHHWYEAKRPAGSLSLQCSRQEQTILTRFRSGHLRALIFKDVN